MPATRAILSEGLRLGFRANRPELLSKLPSVLVPGSVPTEFEDLDFVYSIKAEAERKHYAAYCGSRALIRRTSLGDALASIASSVQDTVAEHSRQHLFLHAGVIGWGGKAVLFPGRTRSGKSTLIRALIRAGAVYFSDEFARIDAHGLVHPFPRPLSLRSPEGTVVVRPEEEGAGIASKPCPIGAVIMTQFRADGIWRPSPLSPGEAALALLRNTVAIRSDPAKAIRRMSTLASQAGAIRSFRGDVETDAPAVLRTAADLVHSV